MNFYHFFLKSLRATSLLSMLFLADFLYSQELYFIKAYYGSSVSINNETYTNFNPNNNKAIVFSIKLNFNSIEDWNLFSVGSSFMSFFEAHGPNGDNDIIFLVSFPNSTDCNWGCNVNDDINYCYCKYHGIGSETVYFGDIDPSFR